MCAEWAGKPVASESARRTKGVRSGPQALVASLGAPHPVRSSAGRDAYFRKGNQDARSLLDLTPTAQTCRAHDPAGQRHLGRAIRRCPTAAP
jgi:hypothetical protein